MVSKYDEVKQFDTTYVNVPANDIQQYAKQKGEFRAKVKQNKEQHIEMMPPHTLRGKSQIIQCKVK
jgi:hypothetical protein